MKTELFGGSQDGKPIELKGNIPSEILVPVIPGLIDMIEDPDDDPTQPFQMTNLSYILDRDGRYKAKDMTK